MRLISRFAVLIVCLNVMSHGGVHAAFNPKSNPPATLDKPGDELALNRIKITAKAKERLGIKLVTVESQSVTRYRMYSGEILLPAVDDNKATAGSQNRQSVVGIIGVMNPSELVRIAESQIEADGRVATALVRLNLARIERSRAEKLLARNAGSQKALDQARADYEMAAADLQTMKNRRKLLGPPALATQMRDSLWVRVSVFVNDVDRLDLSAPARLGRLGSHSADVYQDVTAVAKAPMFARNDSSTVDLFYAVDNRAAGYRPNQRVGVSVPLREKSKGLVVPRSAILHDIHGNTWVYTQIDDLTYVRRRVEVRFSKAGLAVLDKGLSIGTLVVTDGAPELFGTEFGIGK